MSPSADTPRLDHHRAGPALRVVIHNPGRANALTHDMLRDLASLLEGPAPAGVPAVVLTGAGTRHFCAGLDLAGIAPEHLVAHLRAGEDLLFAASEAVVACRRPVIAAIGGSAVGGGLELAMACDWRIAATEARLSMPAARLGVVYQPAGLRRAVALMGAARTRRLFLTGRPVRADEALALGLVDQVVPAADLDGAVARAVEDLAAMSPTAVEGTRAIIRALAAGDPDADEVARVWRERAFGGADLAEGLRAFAEGRPPVHRLPDAAP